MRESNGALEPKSDPKFNRPGVLSSGQASDSNSVGAGELPFVSMRLGGGQGFAGKSRVFDPPFFPYPLLGARR